MLIVTGKLMSFLALVFSVVSFLREIWLVYYKKDFRKTARFRAASRHCDRAFFRSFL